ncbi:TetR/AcrR family transcriptional regulator [Candidatus Pelagadaptatus aseana]|uniref:TetR/AcrR family transcriptional regulator n=1 Tax=Candidatus Pelagadaptatus aseana TaxID=3120508 RepID=UPI003C6FCDAF
MADTNIDGSRAPAPGSKEAAIMDAAIYLFADKGLQETSTRKIAAEAGVSEGTLFNLFGSKRELMHAILANMYQDLTRKATEGFRDILGTRDRLQFLAENHIRTLQADNGLFIRLVHSYIGSDLSNVVDVTKSQLYKLNQAYTWVFDLAIKEGIERGEIRSDTVLPAARDLFFGGLEYCMRTMFAHEVDEKFKDYIHSVVEPIWLGIKVQSEASTGSGQHLLDVCERLERVADKLES